MRRVLCTFVLARVCYDAIEDTPQLQQTTRVHKVLVVLRLRKLYDALYRRRRRITRHAKSLNWP